MAQSIQTIGIANGGGDCPGLNAVIRGVVRAAILGHGWRVIGINDGFDGLIWTERTLPLTVESIAGILPRGGTILGTTNRGNPFHYAMDEGGKKVEHDYSLTCLENARKLGMDAIIAIGGDGTHTIAESHGRVMVIEVMGRDAGWIALHSGLAGGADVILIPEIPFTIETVCEAISQREAHGRSFCLVVVAEGVKLPAQDGLGKPFPKPQPGQVGNAIGYAIREYLKKEVRVTVLGHVQRG